MEFYDLKKFGILRKVEMTEPQGNFLFMNLQIFLILFAAFCGVITSQKCSQFLTVAPVSYQSDASDSSCSTPWANEPF
jgi:hypothetical protein